MKHSKIYAVIALTALIPLGGCASVASGISDVVVSTTTAGPTQAKSVAEAIRATKLVEDGLDLYVATGSPSMAILNQLNILVPAMHRTLVAAETAQASGNSAAIASALAAFNESLAAVQSYKALKGV